MYFVRRKGKVKGPLTQDRLRELRDEDRLRMRDEISQSPDGPWQRLVDVYTEVLGEEEPAVEADSGFDEEFWSSEAGKPSHKRREDGTASKLTRAPVTGVVGVTLKPWQWTIVGVVASVLATLGVAAGIHIATLGTETSDPNEIAANANASGLRPRKQVRPRAAPEPPQPDTPPASPAPAPPAEADSASQQKPAKEPAENPETDDETPTAEASPAQAAMTDDEAAEEAPEPQVSQDPAADVRKLLAAYYSAGDWEDRYRTVVPNNDARDMMRRLYDDVDWVAVQWSVAKMPDNKSLTTAARQGERVRIDTVTNGNPHSVYVIFSKGRWRVDWVHSLHTLWLSK